MRTDLKKEKLPAPATTEPQEIEQQIRLRAYQFYEERGREDGHELEDWIRAEDEIVEKSKLRTIAA